MDTRNVNLLNSALIVVSLVLAFLLPFKLFLFSYAVLGPLHYLTEINWLHERKYWVPDFRWLAVGLIAVAVIAPPHIIAFADPDRMMPTLWTIADPLHSISTGAIFFSLSLAVILVFFKRNSVRSVLSFAALVLAWQLNSQNIFLVVVGLLIPTLIHVYLFTLLFMGYGVARNPEKLGWLSLMLMIGAPLIIIFMDIDPSTYFFSDPVKETYLASTFHSTVASFGKLIGVMDGTSFYFYEKAELKIQTFFAFAYLYHYLNWFTKTSIIGWHTSLKGARAVVVVAVWVLMIIAFVINYRFGLVFALGLSFLHVILEFPLNVHSIKGIAQKLTTR